MSGVAIFLVPLLIWNIYHAIAATSHLVHWLTRNGSPANWFLGNDHQLLRPDSELARRLSNLGIGRMDKVVTYSTTGARAAIGYLALKRAGYDVRVLPNQV